ncbi:MAG: hypothetical protein HRU25_07505 [Psychrobium sp.]|nr:hypothetical protein [Psychrobium sp.]
MATHSHPSLEPETPSLPPSNAFSIYEHGDENIVVSLTEIADGDVKN